jgi:hypothetical protein
MIFAEMGCTNRIKTGISAEMGCKNEVKTPNSMQTWGVV